MASLSYVVSQTISSLEGKKNKLQKELVELDKMIKQAEGNKNASLVKLNALRQKITVRNSYINSLRKEIGLLVRDIDDDSDIIFALESDMNHLKKEYAQMIYVSSKVNNSFNKLTFVFSAKTFNQLTMRMKYLTMFSRARRIQVEKIKSLKKHLERQKEKLQSKLGEKKELLASLRQEKGKLNSNKKEEESELKKEAKKVAEYTDSKKKKDRELKSLNRLILDLIKKQQKKLAKSQYGYKKEIAIVSKNFEANKGRLNWPLSNCFVSRKFGKQPHPVLKGVYVNNLGIGLQTTKGASVRSIFAGKVSIGNIPGMGKVVMIQHGTYYTVYANMNTVLVKSGDEVKAKQTIGTVVTRDGETELEFQIWKSIEKLNPQSWLAKL
ncbi:MAG: murein hydrolase activator EnvC [Cyclobacteriaceae bacterium]